MFFMKPPMESLASLLAFLCLALGSSPTFSRHSLSSAAICQASIESGDGLYYICSCHQVPAPPTPKGEDPAEQPTLEGQAFDLAKFAYSLPGTYFSKSVHLTFRNCQNLKIRLNQAELSRLGSTTFRPDMSVGSCFVESVYHLELLGEASDPRQESETVEYLGKSSQTNDGPEVMLYSVAMVRIDANARLGSLVTSSNNTLLYIDLSWGQLEDVERLVIGGFSRANIYLVTKRHQEDQVSLPNEMGSISTLDVDGKSMNTMPTTVEASSSPKRSLIDKYYVEIISTSVVFGLVILAGTLGLILTLVHRRKKKGTGKFPSMSSRVAGLGRLSGLPKLSRSQKLLPSYGGEDPPVFSILPDSPPDRTEGKVENASSGMNTRRTSSKNSFKIQQQRQLDPAADASDPSKHDEVDLNGLLSSILYRVRSPKDDLGNQSSEEAPGSELGSRKSSASQVQPHKDSRSRSNSRSAHPFENIAERAQDTLQESHFKTCGGKISQHVFLTSRKGPERSRSSFKDVGRDLEEVEVEVSEEGSPTVESSSTPPSLPTKTKIGLAKALLYLTPAADAVKRSSGPPYAKSVNEDDPGSRQKVPAAPSQQGTHGRMSFFSAVSKISGSATSTVSSDPRVCLTLRSTHERDTKL